MRRISITDAWDETSAFVRRELGLLLPIAFATLGLATILYGLAVPAPAPGSTVSQPQPGPWMFVLLLVVPLFLIGSVALAGMALRPGGSVGEALGGAARRLPVALLAVLLFVIAVSLGMVVITLIALAIGLAVGWPVTMTTTLALLLAVPVLVYVTVRLATLWPAVADRAAGWNAVAVLRAAFAGTRGATWPLLGAIIIYALAYLIILAAVQFGLGSVLLVIGKAAGQQRLAEILILVLGALVGAALQAVWCVFTAMIYRRLSEPSMGI